MPKKSSSPTLQQIVNSMNPTRTVADLEALAANVLNGSHTPTTEESKRLAASVLGKKES